MSVGVYIVLVVRLVVSVITVMLAAGSGKGSWASSEAPPAQPFPPHYGLLRVLEPHPRPVPHARVVVAYGPGGLESGDILDRRVTRLNVPRGYYQVVVYLPDNEGGALPGTRCTGWFKVHAKRYITARVVSGPDRSCALRNP